MKRFAYIALLLLTFPAIGQLSTLKFKKLKPRQHDTLLVDSLAVVSGSVYIPNFKDKSDYTLFKGRLVWKAASVRDSVNVIYRIAQYPNTFENRDRTTVRAYYEENPFKYSPTQTDKTEYGNLNTRGNISRGIGMGNAQDIVVNSNLNLRLNGIIANDVDVLAVISDENNPIQPEGNTQQIQDFDRIFITLKKDSGVLTVGDFLMQKPKESYFLNYYKKSRGLQLSNVLYKDDWRIKLNAEAAISRGKFSRNTIEGIEGNSGPYRLSGSNGEIFIVVIAGTENVYLDGKKLIRGEDNDYVVNYNSGEITFTPKVLITAYSRILVEFQYSDRNYARSVAHLGTKITKGKYSIYANFFNEMDLKSQPYQQSLDGFDSSQGFSALEVLSNAGDDLAFFRNERKLSQFSTERIMYKKEEQGGIDIFIYTSDPNENTTFYDVSFSYVGVGNGSYNQAQSAANGKVFKFVGEGLGLYEPIEILIAPQRLNSLNLGFIKEDQGKTSGIEFTKSGYDKNTFSNIDDADNGGFGIKAFRKTNKTLMDSTWRFKSALDYEIVNAKYNYIERYRNVEFDRKWNKVISNPTSFSALLPSYEHIANALFALEKGNKAKFINNTAMFFRPNSFSGLSNVSIAEFQIKKIKSATTLELMNSSSTQDSNIIDNLFYSLKSNLQRPFKYFVGGGQYVIENSTFKLNDSLQSMSYGFRAASLFLRNKPESKLKYNLAASQRDDNRPQNEGFVLATVGRDLTLNSSYASKSFNRIDVNTTYRQLQVKDTTLSLKQVENTLQSRIELDFKLFKKFIRSRTFYQLGSGQEQRREFQYLQVQPGNGIYIWNDYDSNGVKTLNEFEIASDLDRQRADHLKIYTPVAGFFTTNSNKVSQTVELNPSVFIKKRGKKKPFYSRFNSISSLILDKKVLPTDFLSFINPLHEQLEDTSLIKSSQSFRTTVFYNRGNPVYSIDYSYVNSNSKLLLTNGFDSRRNNDNILNSRVNLGKKFSLNTRFAQGERLYVSQFFNDRSFNYTYLELEPKLQFLVRNAFRVELKTKYYSAKNNPKYGQENSQNFEIGSNLKYNKVKRGTLEAGASYIKVKFNGEASSTLGYELLRGLQNGNNATWNFNYKRTLVNNIQVLISYDGRKSEDAPVIHIGRLVARYLF